jgi:hypothetical protein
MQAITFACVHRVSNRICRSLPGTSVNHGILIVAIVRSMPLLFVSRDQVTFCPLRCVVKPTLLSVHTM